MSNEAPSTCSYAEDRTLTALSGQPSGHSLALLMKQVASSDCLTIRYEVACFMKYQKCQMQMAAYALALEHTVNIKPELIMTFVATKEKTQVFAIQSSTIEKYKEKWLAAVEKYYEEILKKEEEAKVEMEAVDEDKKVNACLIN